MKQRIRVAGIIRRGEEVLVLKRAMGRSEEPSWYELLTGKIEYGEQPEEAMSRAVSEYIGGQVASVKLKDAITFTALENSSQLSNLYIIYDIKLVDEKIEAREKYSSYKFVSFAGLSGVRLDEATMAVLGIEAEGEQKIENYRETANSATVFVDGCSKGNPGPSGIGYYIIGENGEVLKRGGEFVGFATSRVAEYYALKEGIEQALELGLSSVKFVSDNLMMVNQMRGIYQVKNMDLVPIYEDIMRMLPKFEAVAFMHVNRKNNVEADREANIAVEKWGKL